MCVLTEAALLVKASDQIAEQELCTETDVLPPAPAPVLLGRKIDVGQPKKGSKVHFCETVIIAHFDEPTNPTSDPEVPWEYCVPVPLSHSHQHSHSIPCQPYTATGWRLPEYCCMASAFVPVTAPVFVRPSSVPYFQWL
eukprot:TRINITY_DN61041_c0_g2_i1.p1 TRINITY_DN61041_c0_g2~~TRINITY_DN61041_c0_g2_i1.p1  ORF type:complete len:139 (+),score=3.37 TRINITY_DN61041_c0_g2_i1:140-556(+)